VDTCKVRDSQIKRWSHSVVSRDEAHVPPRWPTDPRASMGGNLLGRGGPRKLPVARAPPVGEISMRMKEKFGRSTAHEVKRWPVCMRGLMKLTALCGENSKIIRSRISPKPEGRRRVCCVVKMGQDGQRSGAKGPSRRLLPISALLDVGPLFSRPLPKRAGRPWDKMTCMSIGISSQAAAITLGTAIDQTPR